MHNLHVYVFWYSLPFSCGWSHRKFWPLVPYKCHLRLRLFELTEICGLQQYQCLTFLCQPFTRGPCITEWTQNLSATLGGRCSFMEEFGRWKSTGLSNWPKVVQQGADSKARPPLSKSLIREYISSANRHHLPLRWAVSQGGALN